MRSVFSPVGSAKNSVKQLQNACLLILTFKTVFFGDFSNFSFCMG